MSSPSGSTFSLRNKGLKLDTSSDLDTHCSRLKTPNSITHLDLSGNTLGAPFCASLAPLLSSQTTLLSADLHDIFTSRLLEEIPPALSSLLTALLQCPKLSTIDLSDNAFGLNTKDPLVDFLSKHTPLQHLILNNNGMGPIAGAAIAQALTQLSTRKAESRKARDASSSSSSSSSSEIPGLESIVCGRNRLENGSMAAWATMYTAHAEHIKSVKMTQNGIRQEGISHLLQNGLRACTSLEILDMQDNTFTLLGASALADAVGEWPNLQELGVGDDLLGARGAVKVFEALGKGRNKKTEVLRLQYNDIDAKGVKALVQAVKDKDSLPVLRRVELNGNKFSEDDASIEALAEILSERKDEHGKDDDPEDHWGIDELDELEEESDEEDEGEEGEEKDEDVEKEEEEQVDYGEKVLKEADEAETEKVPLEKDPEVDELAEKLGKTAL
ncbi:MAG: hypothetical protein Q9227_006234 [Pyrenula ochraceoflavens]